MYINGVARYVPERVLPNSHFLETCGLSDEWIRERTGIIERRMAGDEENANTMGLAAVQELLKQPGMESARFDLIIGATYTPYDTVVTLGHYIQHALQLHDIPTLSISTACSSVLNAIEVAEGYFATGKATRALIVGSEHNTAYFHDDDRVSGPLWGDGAVAISVSKAQIADRDMKITYLKTGGAATVGKATESVFLRPTEGVFLMPNGRDVFINACEYMTRNSREALAATHLTIEEIDYFIPHQANLRISLHVAKELHLPEGKMVSNIERYGNTGCCGFGIGLAETYAKIKKGDKILVSVFGGGYSFGSMVIEA